MKEFAFPLLKRVGELYTEANLENVLLLASQHLLEPQKRMFELLLAAGLKPENCIIAGKSYSTNSEIMNDLLELGCVVAPFSDDFDVSRSFDEWFEENLSAFISQELGTRRLSDYQKVIVLDDGGFMHVVVNRFAEDASNIVGIEQTSSGHHKIQAEKIRFPMISVARSVHKLTFESPYIGQNGYNRIVRHLAIRGKDHPNILVLGLGAIGRQIAGQFFTLRNYKGRAADLNICGSVLDSRVAQLLRNRGRIISVEAAVHGIGEFDVIIGATGFPVLTESDIDCLHPQVSLISMSSSDREFPALAFRSEGGKIHEDCYRGEMCLVNAGFPITFDGCSHAMPPQQIELIIALMMIRLLDEASDRRLRPLANVVDQIQSMWNPREGADDWYKSFSMGSS